MFDTSRVDPVLHDVLHGLAKLAALDPTAAGDDELCDTARVLETARRFLDATQHHTLAELDTRATTDRAHGMRTGPWLARDTQLPATVANQQVRLAIKLRRVLPAVADALAEGRINVHHARVLADAANPRIATPWAPVAALLCDAVEGVTFDQWRREAQSLAELLDQDGGHNPNHDTPTSRLGLNDVGETTTITGELTGDDALITSEALNTIADELFHQHRRDRHHSPTLPLPTRAELLAQALVEVCRRGLATDLHTTKPPRGEATLVLTPDHLDTHHQFHQALAEHGFTTPAAPSVGAVGAGGCCSGALTITDTHGSPLAAGTVASWLCDIDLYTVIVDSLGVPIDMGRRTRFATTAQRRALSVRDGGCTFPGCTAPPTWTDAHHRVGWTNGGTTDLAELLSLCRHHHRVAHRAGWSVTITDDGWSRWTDPTGHTFWGQQHQHQRPQPGPGP